MNAVTLGAAETLDAGELGQQADVALEPVRRALRDAAEEEASRVLADSRRQAAVMAQNAAAQAARIADDAAAQGEADALSDARSRTSRARRAAREAVLAAQEGVRSEFLRELQKAARAARNDPRYPALLARLGRLAVETLGPGAALSESPDGGILAQAGARRMDLSLPSLAIARVDEAPEEVARLWQE